jgi:hypothetical protein
MVKVNRYIKRSSKGKVHSVKPHSRNYNIQQKRQLPNQYKNPFSLVVDSEIKALKPGKRISKNNNIYYERRFNRSDSGEFL